MASYEEQRFGNYRIIRKLGKGGFAEVYLGEHIHLNTKAAIKVQSTQLTDEEKGHFIKEARTIANLKHPNIVRVLEFSLEKDTLFLVMEYAPNGSLRERHPGGTVLPLATVVSYVKQVADALQYAHDQYLIHRDIKPENMLVASNNAVLLSDFGIATVAHRTSTQNTSVIAGTAIYMPPELFRGKSYPASDQYALAVVVYEWLSGEPPFYEGDFIQLGYQHSYVPPAPLSVKMPLISREVESVVNTALAKDPKQRFGSIKAFATALEQASQEKSPPPPNIDSETLTPNTKTDTFTSDAISGPLTTVPSISSLPKDAQLNLDTLPPSDLFNRILREIGKNARNAR